MTNVSNTTHDPVDRLAEDFLVRYRQGERPSVSEYVRQFPDVADQVAEVIQVMLMLEDLGAEHAEDSEDSVASIPAQLGDFRILRELGRGGMGVVYEAIQEELGRHVAIKVLPTPALLKPTQLERFRREAKTAARLHHTNIVPVFGVGVENGIHYYAMQFIAGQGLDSILKQVRKEREAHHTNTTIRDAVAATHQSNISGYSTRYDYARTVARIGEQIASALAHAHVQGVLHRDVKPSNILLDQEGRAWLSDFGLAQFDTDDQLTGTGDIVGTLRYMAPERFKRQSDARSDIYSLGMTIYELLTLRPGFQETDRAKLIHQILNEESAAPRQIDPVVPRDLETIILKAITKEPEHRYQKADDLADDLNRFLIDRPVTARRLRWWERSWRWTQRNRLLSITALAAFSALIIGLSLTYWQWQRAEENAEAKRLAAEAALLNQRKAEANAALAWRGFRGILEALNYSSNKPISVLKRQIFQQALQLHEEYLQTVDDAPCLLEKGRIANELGKLWHKDNDLVNAEKNFLVGVHAYESLLQSQPNHPDAPLELGISLGDLASMLVEKKPDQALPCVMKSIALLRNVIDAAPNELYPRYRLAYNLETLAILQKEDQHAWEPAIREAIQHLDFLMNVPPAPRVDHKVLLTRCKRTYATILEQHQRLPEARMMADAALKLAKGLAGMFPKRDDFQQLTADCSTKLGHVLILQNEQAQAETVYGEAASIYRILLQHDPQNADVQKKLAAIMDKPGVGDNANGKK